MARDQGASCFDNVSCVSSLNRCYFTSITNVWVAVPTRSIFVASTFSLPQISAFSSSFRTCRSIVAVTATCTWLRASGVPESRPVAGSIFSHAGPWAMANLGFSMSK